MAILKPGIRARQSLIGDQVRRGLVGVNLSGPTNTQAPSISGDAEVGAVLTCDPGLWEGTGTVTIAFQWLRDGAEIVGATSATYTLVSADEGAAINCRVTASDDVGSDSRLAGSVGPVTVPPDADAAAYIAAVETADGQALEAGVKTAINDFVVGLKADGIWSDLDTSCILAGARTLNGALVPLKGTAPTNVNFVGADYARKTGLVGDAATKYLDTNVADTSLAQDDRHAAVFTSTTGTLTSAYLQAESGSQSGNTNLGNRGDGTVISRFTSVSFVSFGPLQTGFIGASRALSASFDVRMGGSTTTGNIASTGRAAGNLGISATGDGAANFTDARTAFYSLGAATDLAALDTRVSALMTAIDGAIA